MESRRPDGLLLKRSSVLIVVLLTFLTMGIYSGIWYLRRRRALNALDTTTKLGVVLPVLLIVATVAFLLAPEGSNSWWVFRLAYAAAILVLAFKVRGILIEHLRRRISAVLPMSASIQEQNFPSSILTFLLNFWYLQYRINELVETDAAWATSEVPT